MNKMSKMNKKHKTSVMLEPYLTSREVLAASPESHCSMLHPCIRKSVAGLPSEKEKCGPQ